MNINEFLSQVNQGGFARVTDFQVMIFGPTALGTQQNLTFRTEQVSFPGRQVQSHDYMTYGPHQKVGYAQLHDNVEITVAISADMREKLFFERWQDLAVGGARGAATATEGMFDIGYYDDYKGQVEIVQYDVMGTEVNRCKLLEAWPTTISPLQADWSNEGFHKLQVSFAYRYFTDEQWALPSATANTIG